MQMNTDSFFSLAQTLNYQRGSHLFDLDQAAKIKIKEKDQQISLK